MECFSILRQYCQDSLTKTVLNGFHDIDRSTEDQVADFRMPCIIGPAGGSTVVFLLPDTNVGAMFQKNGGGAHVSMKGCRVERRVSPSGIDSGLRVVADIHGSTSANQCLYDRPGREFARADDEVAPAVARLEDFRVSAEQLVEIPGSLQGDGGGQSNFGATIQERLSHGRFTSERGLVERREAGFVEGFRIGVKIKQRLKRSRLLLNDSQVQRHAALVSEIHSPLQIGARPRYELPN